MMNTALSGLCRDCAASVKVDDAHRCPACGSPRLLRHEELDRLAIAHLDCDAFYAAVEKRDNPDLVDKPVIVGGGRRGVVSTACYIARMYGIHSAMPMFKALEACPDATVVRPDMKRYQEVGRQVRAMMEQVSSAVQPMSIDEAYLDMRDAHADHGKSPSRLLVELARNIESDVGITVSIGLSYNKFLAKLASDMDKPRGFAVVGRGEARAFLAPLPVARLSGVGPSFARRLARDGINTIGQLQGVDAETLSMRYGSMGGRLASFAAGEDGRHVHARSARKSVSSETTFRNDIGDFDALNAAARELCDHVARRLQRAKAATVSVVLKLKSANFQLRTRSTTLSTPTQRAEVLHQAAASLLKKEVDGTYYRLIGIGAGRLTDTNDADPPDLLEFNPEDEEPFVSATDQKSARAR